MASKAQTGANVTSTSKFCCFQSLNGLFKLTGFSRGRKGQPWESDSTVLCVRVGTSSCFRCEHASSVRDARFCRGHLPTLPAAMRHASVTSCQPHQQDPLLLRPHGCDGAFGTATVLGSDANCTSFSRILASAGSDPGRSARSLQPALVLPKLHRA